MTVEFDPSEPEQRLYELVNDYLQREELYAFSQSTRHLSALIIRKRLGSSTYAIASTLENVAGRLEGEIAEGRRSTSTSRVLVDADLTDEESEGIDDEPVAQSVDLDRSNVALMREEARELREYATLARSITVNEKAVQLNHALDLGFERLQELGAAHPHTAGPSICCGLRDHPRIDVTHSGTGKADFAWFGTDSSCRVETSSSRLAFPWNGMMSICCQQELSSVARRMNCHDCGRS